MGTRRRPSQAADLPPAWARRSPPGRDLHSLRTTFSSIAADAGYSEIIVAALLGHRVAAGVTERNIHPDRPAAPGADVTSAMIAAALAGHKPAEVVPTDRQRRA